MAWREVPTLLCHLIKARLFTGKGIIKWQHGAMIIFSISISTCILLPNTEGIFMLFFMFPEHYLLLRKKRSGKYIEYQDGSLLSCPVREGLMKYISWNLMSADIRKTNSQRWALQNTWQPAVLSMPWHFLIIKCVKYPQNVIAAWIYAVLAQVLYMIWIVCICKYCLCSQEAEKAWTYLHHRERLL